jgi:hypothetical protein
MPDTALLLSFYNSARLISRLKSYPLLREPTHYTYRETYAQNVANFTRTALDTAHPDVSALKLVDEDILTQREDLVEFFRTYATVPAQWEEVVSQRFDYPGYVGTYANPGSEISSGVTMANSGTGSALVITKTAHGRTTGEWLWVKFTANGVRWQTHAYITAHTTDTLRLSLVFIGSWTFSAVSYWRVDGAPSRVIRSQTVNARVVYDYALPGVTSGVSTAQDFEPLPELPFIGSSSGEPVTHLSATTVPTNAQWIASALAREWFVRESIVRPYLGRILERVTSYLPYRL